MIEKIRITEQGLYNEHGTFLGTMPKDTDSLTLANKINELVDAVNGILDYAPLEMAMKAEPAENSQSANTGRQPVKQMCAGHHGRKFNKGTDKYIQRIRNHGTDNGPAGSMRSNEKIT